MDKNTNRIKAAFSRRKAAGGIALMPFIPAGYPDLQTTAALLPALQAAGADLIELGFPFSDPIADGPAIQEAFAQALRHKLKVTDIFKTVASVRDKVSIPLLAMVSYSIVYRYGSTRFFADAVASGFDGLIIPDLPMPEGEAVATEMVRAGLDCVPLIAPTTPDARRSAIARVGSGFVYYLSVSGVTGERATLPADLAEHVAAVKRLTPLPVCVGFGLSTAAQVAALAGFADGAIIGSAFVKRMKSAGDPKSVAIAVAAYCRELRGN